jgi:hypothetical protein
MNFDGSYLLLAADMTVAIAPPLDLELSPDLEEFISVKGFDLFFFYELSYFRSYLRF